MDVEYDIILITISLIELSCYCGKLLQNTAYTIFDFLKWRNRDRK